MVTFLKLKENNFGFEILNNDYLLGIYEDGKITLMRRKEFMNLYRLVTAQKESTKTSPIRNSHTELCENEE